MSIGGNAAVLAGNPEPSVSDLHSCTAPAAADDHFSRHFGLSEALDADRYVLESGLFSSPNSADYENDHLACDSTLFSGESFDITQFLNDEVNNSVIPDSFAGSDAADPLFGHLTFDLETQVSSENPNLQPQSGASSYGCDDGGLAVGV